MNPERGGAPASTGASVKRSGLDNRPQNTTGYLFASEAARRTAAVARLLTYIASGRVVMDEALARSVARLAASAAIAAARAEALSL